MSDEWIVYIVEYEMYEGTIDWLVDTIMGIITINLKVESC